MPGRLKRWRGFAAHILDMNQMTPEQDALLESRRKPSGRFGERGFPVADLSLGAAAMTFEELQDFHTRNARLAKVATENRLLSTVALAARGILIDHPDAANAVLVFDPVDEYLVKVHVYGNSGEDLGAYDVESMYRSGDSAALPWLDQLEDDTKDAVWKRFTPTDRYTIDLAAAAAWVPEEDPAP